MSGEGKLSRPVIELVTHCYASKLSQYARALRYQLSSLVFCHAENCDVVATVCFNEEDKCTREVFADFVGRLNSGRVKFQGLRMSIPELGRRCIGRNRAALQSQADIVWFTDVDHVFLPPCFDALVELEWPEDTTMIYPKRIMIHRDHYLGDDYLTREPRNGVLDWIDRNDFMPKTYDRPVGGVQIVKGDTARKYGYLNGEEKWMRPTETPFGDFRDDIAFRKMMGRLGVVKGVSFDGVYRLRHIHTTYPVRQELIPRGANG